MENKRFIALGDLIADAYYNGTKLLGVDGGSSRYNVIANLAQMNCKCAVIGGCGNDRTGRIIVKRLENMGVDTSGIFCRDRQTRAYNLIINKDNFPKITYHCSKYSPKTGELTWYEDTSDDILYCFNNVKNTDVIVLDTLDDFSLDVIDKFKCDKILDIGNTKHLESLTDNQIDFLRNKLEIIQLNARTIPYLMQRFKCQDIVEINKFFQSKLLIITHGSDGANFTYGDTFYEKKLLKSANELDATGAGDAFLSVFAKEYYNNSKFINNEFIDNTFNEAIDLTSKVVQSLGARGHIYERSLDKIEKRTTLKADEGRELEL